MNDEERHAVSPAIDVQELQRENADLGVKLAALQQAVASIVYVWRNFDDPTLAQRKLLYDAYVKSGGEVS